MSAKPSLDELRAAARKVEKKWAEAEAEEKMADKEFEAAKDAMKEMGFKNPKALAASVEEDKAEYEEVMDELTEMLKDFL